LVPDPFFKPGKALIIAQHNNDCAAKGTGVRQLYSPSQHGATPQVSTAATRFAPKGQHRPALWNPFRVRVQISTWGGVHPHLRILLPKADMRARLSGSVAALTSSINANTFNAQMSPRTSFFHEPKSGQKLTQKNRIINVC